MNSLLFNLPDMRKMCVVFHKCKLSFHLTQALYITEPNVHSIIKSKRTFEFTKGYCLYTVYITFM